MRKRFIALIACGALAATSLAGFAGCGGGNTITIWGPGEHQEFLKEVMNEYVAQQGEDYKYKFNFTIVSEAEAYSTINTDVKAGADVFAFANDQLVNLYKVGALARVSDTVAATVESENSKAAYDMGVIGNALYAYPYSADNGFFMFYDKTVVPDADAGDLDKVLEDIAAHDKKFIVDHDDAWYAGSMIYGAGGTYVANYNEQGLLTSVDTNFGEKPQDGEFTYGALGANGWATLVQNSVVMTGDNTVIKDTANAGDLGAVITGTWNAGVLETAWEDGYAATTLPQWKSKLDGETHDWYSFAGGKLYGVNSYSKHLEEAHKVAQYLSSKAIQEKRFDELQVGPSNKEIAAMDKVNENVALGALIQQMNGHAVAQRPMPQTYWDALGAFGTASANMSLTDTAALETYIQDMVTALKAVG